MLAAGADVFVSGAGPLAAGVRGIILVVHDTGTGSRRRLTVDTRPRPSGIEQQSFENHEEIDFEREPI